MFPLIDVSRDQLAEVVGGRIIHAEPVEGGLTNTIHKVVTESNETFGVKHYAGGRDWFDTELTTLTLLHGTLPIPEVVHVDDARLVIVYRWIEGMTLLDLRRKGHKEGFASLAEPLGRVLAALATTDATEPFDLAPMLDASYVRLTDGRARGRLGAPLADALRKEIEAAEPMMAWGPVCLSHGDLSHRNVIVARRGSGWRINGVIDWETATTSSPLFDIGSLMRYGDRHDPAWLEAFARGYRDHGGQLPEGWNLWARLLDCLDLVELLDEEQGLQVLFDDCRTLIAKLVADVARSRGAA
ncbi:MAG TPA: aminoglycoside phosphotransferase family protein [Kofleriaceae bacterium]